MPTPLRKIFLTGATGFVGTHVLAELVRQNYHVHALVRRPDSLPLHPQVTPFVGTILDPASLAPALASCDAAIHLVGIIAEPRRGPTFHQIHVQGSQNVADAARAANISRYVHMSALGTRPNAPSTYHQTKWRAEEYLRHASLPYTIFRPSLIHGPDGEFTRMLRNWSLGSAPPFLFMPFFGAGLLGQSNPHLLQPVFVDDVARLFVDALANPLALHKTYPVGGPKTYTWREFLRLASTLFRGKPKPALGIPVWYGKLLTALPIPLPFNRDQLLMSQEENAADLAPLVADFPSLTLQDFASTLAAYRSQMSP